MFSACRFWILNGTTSLLLTGISSIPICAGRTKRQWEQIESTSKISDCRQNYSTLELASPIFILHWCKLTNLLVPFSSLWKLSWLPWLMILTELFGYHFAQKKNLIQLGWLCIGWFRKRVHCILKQEYSASGCKRMRSWCRIVRWFCRRLWRQKLSSKCFVLDYISGDQDLHVSIQ